MPRPSPQRLDAKIDSFYFLQRLDGTTQDGGWSDATNYNYREYTSAVTPGFPKVIRDNSFDLFVLRFNYSGVKWAREFKVHTGLKNDVFEGVGFLPETIFGPGIHYLNYNSHLDLYGKMMTEHLNDVVDSKVNLPVFVAEARKTCSLIAKTAIRLAKAMKAAKRLDAASMYRHLGIIDTKTISKRRWSDTYDPALSLWLEAQYGWKPLLSEVKGAAEHLARMHLAQPRVHRVDTQVRGKFDYSSLHSYNFGSFHEIHRGTTYARIRTSWTIDSEFFRGASQLQISNPLTLAWEVLPFSFVADWFIPIGSYLSTLGYSSGLDYVGGFWSYRTPSTTTFRPTGLIVKSADQDGVMTGAGVLREEYRFTRYPLPTLPQPVLPSFDVFINASRALSGVSLLKLAAYNRI